MEVILNMRKEIKARKDFAASDRLRNDLSKFNITIKDTKDGAIWSI
jgi:cysteinyl-tRNA synthetase